MSEIQYNIISTKNNNTISLNRRSFFKTAAVAGLTITGIDLSRAGNTNEREVEFYGILYDSTRCVGCRACESACAEAHGFPVPEDELTLDVLRNTSETKRSVINQITSSKGEVFIRKMCMHCNEPACVAACLTQAMYKTREGPVVWRGEKCMGCRYCMVSCPFNIPKFEYYSANPKIQKCDMCYERIVKGEKPVCVENCGDALYFGTRRELIAEARKRITENPDKYIDTIYGEKVAGNTSTLYVSAVQFNELGFNDKIANSSYPAMTKGFLYSVPSVFVLIPTLLLGIHEATKINQNKNNENE